MSNPLKSPLDKELFGLLFHLLGTLLVIHQIGCNEVISWHQLFIPKTRCYKKGTAVYLTGFVDTLTSHIVKTCKTYHWRPVSNQVHYCPWLSLEDTPTVTACSQSTGWDPVLKLRHDSKYIKCCVFICSRFPCGPSSCWDFWDCWEAEKDAAASDCSPRRCPEVLRKDVQTYPRNAEESLEQRKGWTGTAIPWHNMTCQPITLLTSIGATYDSMNVMRCHYFGSFNCKFHVRKSMKIYCSGKWSWIRLPQRLASGQHSASGNGPLTFESGKWLGSDFNPKSSQNTVKYQCFFALGCSETSVKSTSVTFWNFSEKQICDVAIVTRLRNWEGSQNLRRHQNFKLRSTARHDPPSFRSLSILQKVR